MIFSDFNFDPKIQACLDRAGFTAPTPIQEQAIPIVMEGHDVMGLAQTGTGKTAAFILPIIEKICKERSNKVKAVIIAPTRELAQQIHDVAQQFGKNVGVRTMTIYGGASMARQVHQLRRGVDLVVACPGRLYDHMRQGTIRLGDLQYLVLDEADQMFDMGFIPTIRRILENIPAERQTLMFSATMPHDIRQLAAEILQNPKHVEISNSEPVATVSHALYPVSQHLKTDLLVKLLQHTNTDSVLVFVKMKHSAQKLCDVLEDQGFKVTSLQGNLSQGRRMASMRGFKSGEFQIMIATDIAARGIDISTISHVINYDMPDTPEAYTHRIGRTGRAAKTGDAFTFVAPHDTAIVRRIEKTMGAKIERRELEDFDYGSRAKAKLNSGFRGERENFEDQPRGRQQRSRSSHSDSWGNSEQPREQGRPRRSSGNFGDQARSHSGPQQAGSFRPARRTHSGDAFIANSGPRHTDSRERPDSSGNNFDRPARSESPSRDGGFRSERSHGGGQSSAGGFRRGSSSSSRSGGSGSPSRGRSSSNRMVTW